MTLDTEMYPAFAQESLRGNKRKVRVYGTWRPCYII